MININQAFIDKYFKDGFKYSSYLTTVELYNELKIHFDGEYPYKLIDVRRPNENEESKEYRKQIYQPKTKACCTRITNSLSKIRRSPDWLIKFTDIPASIPEDESPEIYINDKFPFFGSLTTWIFSICLKNYLIDSNALCVVAPLSFPEDGSLEYVKPFPRIYNSPKIIDYVEKEYAVVESNEKSTYTDGNVKYYNGRIVLIITTTQYVKYEQTDTKGGMTRSAYYNHNIYS